VVTAEQRRRAVAQVQETAAVSERRACRWLGYHRSAVRYVPLQRGDAALRVRLRELASAYPRWGAPMLTWLLRREGVRDNHKRIRRLYRLEGLGVKRQRRKRVAQPRVVTPGATQPNEHWAMDFMRDTLSDGRAFRTLNIVDAFTRECLAIEVDISLPGARVVRVLEQLRVTRGLPGRITVDNGPEFQSKALDAWAHQRGVQLQFSRPGKPVDNTFIEAFNGRMRDECLNQSWFLTLLDARRTIAAWRETYNTARPHRALKGCTPSGYAEAQLKLVNPTRLSA
jgi:putative transposase